MPRYSFCRKLFLPENAQTIPRLGGSVKRFLEERLSARMLKYSTVAELGFVVRSLKRFLKERLSPCILQYSTVAVLGFVVRTLISNAVPPPVHGEARKGGQLGRLSIQKYQRGA